MSTSTTSTYTYALAGITLIIVIALLAFFPSLNGGFIWDDYRLITENRLIHAHNGLYHFWFTTQAIDYWPMTYSTFWGEWRLWGMNPIGYHVTNLFLHIITSLLIWLILRKLSIPGAFFAAMIFLIHPVNVESVAWIAQRKNLLAMLFFLLAIFFYLKTEIPSPSSHNQTSSFWYWLSLLTFILSMLSKGSVVVLPVLLLGITWWSRPLEKRDLARIAPFFISALLFTIVNIWFQRHGQDVVIRNAGFVERLLGAGNVVWFYLYKAILPLNLSFVYPQWRVQADHPLWWLPLSAALTVTAVLWVYRRKWSRPLLFAWAFFCVSLVPVLGITDVYFMKFSLVSDHYQHIAIIGVVVTAAAGWGVWRDRMRDAVRIGADCVAVAVICTLFSLTWQQCGLYHDEITLYKDTLQKNPDCWMIHNNLGLALQNAGRPEEAIEHYQQALRLKIDYYEAYYNLGNALVQIGQPKEAIKRYDQALSFNPNYILANINMGNALTEIGQPQEAIRYYKIAIRLNPDFAETYYDLGNVYVRLGKPQEAIEYFNQALKIKPDYLQAHNNLGAALAESGQLEKAIEHFHQTLQLSPDDPDTHFNLASTLIQAGQPREAIKHFIKAIEADPEYVDAYFSLALTYAQINRSKEAINTAQKALRIARSKKLSEQVKKIEDWLNSYSAGSPSLQKVPFNSQ
jgi:protein O-mannosyl-transferase